MADVNVKGDLVGLRSFGKAVNTIAEGMVEGAAAFLGRICLPVAEEVGLLLRDQMRHYRTCNAVRIANRAEQMLGDNKTTHVQPRIVHEIIEEGSWVEDSVVQDMWAGLLASACTADGDDDSNLLFVNLLADLTKLQARVLNHVCAEAEKYVSKRGLIMAHQMRMSIEQLIEVTCETDVQRLDRELDHLREVGLIDGGFNPYDTLTFDIMPTPLGLHLYVRSHGSRLSPHEFFSIDLTPFSVDTEEAPEIDDKPEDKESFPVMNG